MGRISNSPNKLSVINKPKPFDDYTLSKLEGRKMLWFPLVKIMK